MTPAKLRALIERNMGESILASGERVRCWRYKSYEEMHQISAVLPEALPALLDVVEATQEHWRNVDGVNFTSAEHCRKAQESHDKLKAALARLEGK